MASGRNKSLLAFLLLLLGGWQRGWAQANGAAAETAQPPQSTDSAKDGQETPVRRVGGSVLPPRLDFHVDPQFSEEARRAKVGGRVLVGLQIDENGNPTHVHVIRGIGHGLDEKALEAVQQYRFRPATENGKPVKVLINSEVNFQIFDRLPQAVDQAAQNSGR